MVQFFRHSMRYLICLSLLPLITASCSFMPSTGPHASSIKSESRHHKAPPVIRVDSNFAAQYAQEVEARRRSNEERLLAELSSKKHIDSVISEGDIFDINVWGQGGGDLADNLVSIQPSSHKFGEYNVNHKGNVILPYLGSVHIAGLSINAAQQKIRTLFAKTHLFDSVEVSLKRKSSHSQHIIILGAVHKPGNLNWNDGGMDLSEAIAAANGYEIGEPLQGTDMGMNVMLARQDRHYDIPLRLALLHKVPLQPGDSITLQHKPQVRVFALGSGWTRPVLLPFPQTPTLAHVLASGKGMNMESAQGRDIFVFKHDRSVIYLINFDKTDGMEASQIFPIEDGDMVYIPVSRSTTLKQILQMFVSVAYPAALGAGIGMGY